MSTTSNPSALSSPGLSRLGMGSRFFAPSTPMAERYLGPVGSGKGTDPIRRSGSFRSSTDPNGTTTSIGFRPSPTDEKLDPSPMCSDCTAHLKQSVKTCRRAWEDIAEVGLTGSQKIEGDVLDKYCRSLFRDCATQLRAAKARAAQVGEGTSGSLGTGAESSQNRWGSAGRGDFLLQGLEYVQYKLGELTSRQTNINDQEALKASQEKAYRFLMSLRAHHGPLGESWNNCDDSLLQAEQTLTSKEGKQWLRYRQIRWRALNDKVHQQLEAAASLKADDGQMMTETDWGTLSKAAESAVDFRELRSEVDGMMEDEGLEDEG